MAKVLGLASALLQASARHAINSTTSSICQQVVADEVAIWPLRLEAPWPVARLRTSSKTDPARCRQVASDLARVSVLVEVSAQVWASAPEQVSSPQQVSALEQASARVSASDREQAPDPDNYRATEGLPETGRTASRIAKVVKEIDKTDAMKSAIK
ncbi:MAG: hypothetical protein K8T91_19105 [Planctomycetes bacterium]|nr:hypothetical protein [Planctomycetota bacterium]